MNWPRATVILRWVIAGSLGGGGVYLLARVLTHETDWVSVFGKSLFGLAGLMTGVLLVAPELVRWAVAPISHLLDSILLPSETVHPPVDFKLARFYGQTLRYDEACEEYVRILRYHPDNAEAYLEGIRAAALAGNESLARKLYHNAQRIMRKGDRRALLDAVYEARHQPLGGLDESEPETLPESVGGLETNQRSDDPSPAPDRPLH